MTAAVTRRRALLAAAALAAVGPARAAAGPALKAGVYEPPRPAPEIALRGSDGRDVRLGAYRGKLVFLSFGFTNCAAVCPMTLATLAQARKELGAAAADVRVVFVSVDPERDDAQRLKAYLAGFDPTFVGATGSPESLALARKAFGVSATKVPLGTGYAVDHTSSIFIIDREGRLRAMMPYGRASADYVHDARVLLAAR